MARKKQLPATLSEKITLPKVQKSKNDMKIITVDMGSGSMSYNRFEMQISQTLHMAIEFYDNLDYLFVLDYYDDITLFEDENNPDTVSYYQMKTSEDSISISTAISEDWIAKLHEQLKRPEWLVKELGLITNCPLKIVVKNKDESGKSRQETTHYSSEKTSFLDFSSVTIEKIKQDIAKKTGMGLEDVDLSKFVHMRTTLSIPKHREIVEQEMGEFLQKRFSRITLDSVKTIFSAMLEILTKRQQYELLTDNATLEEVREKKGITKSDFVRIIDEAMIISIPPFEDVRKVANFSEEEKYKASYEYTNIMADSQTKPESFSHVFINVRKLCANNKKLPQETIWEYVNRICDFLYEGNFFIESIYNRTYIFVLVICIIINEGRRA